MFAHDVGGGALPAPPWLLAYIGVAIMLGTAVALRATWPATRRLVDVEPGERRTRLAVGRRQRRRASCSCSTVIGVAIVGPGHRTPPTSHPVSVLVLVGRAADRVPARSATSCAG